MFWFEPRPKTIFPKVVLGCLVCLNIIAWTIVWGLNSFDLKVVFFDVGQGDSIFIETGDGFQILIDGGPIPVVLEKLGKEMAFYDRTIELMILTHPDHDHLFGLLEVLKTYKIKNILWTGVVKDTAEWREWIKLIEKEGAKLLIAEAGQRIILSENVFLDILHPGENLEGREFKNSNDTSIVAKLVFEKSTFLFTGDISKKVEKELIGKTKELRTKELSSFVLKAAHHGGKFSSSEEFLKEVSPKTAVISVGENNYGQPDPGVLRSFEELGINILITKELGDIRFSF